MVRTAVNLTFGVFTLELVLAFATNQHLICKTVNDVFSDGTTNGHTSTTPRVLHGPPGKRGQNGVKGEPGVPGLKGEKGLPGVVDPRSIENVVEEKLREAMRDRDRRIENLERVVAEMNSTKERMLAVDCDEGIVFRLKCYFAIIHETRDVNHQQAKSLCAGKGATAANIYNGEHEALVAGNIRKTTIVMSNAVLWLGMSYSSASAIRFLNGTKVPLDDAASMQWWSGFPRPGSIHNTMVIGVNSNALGFFNVYPAYSAHGVLCEK